MPGLSHQPYLLLPQLLPVHLLLLLLLLLLLPQDVPDSFTPTAMLATCKNTRHQQQQQQG
jgi:hypothetical protein